jgi:hypothetical protein
MSRVINSRDRGNGDVAASRLFVVLVAIVLVRIGPTRLMNRYPTRAKVLIAIYAIAAITIALMIAFLL